MLYNVLWVGVVSGAKCISQVLSVNLCHHFYNIVSLSCNAEGEKKLNVFSFPNAFLLMRTVWPLTSDLVMSHAGEIQEWKHKFLTLESSSQFVRVLNWYFNASRLPGFAINVTNTAAKWVGEVHLTLLSASIFSELL